jgi:hypothetical protein
MITRTFTYTNTPADPVIVQLHIWVETDTTDTTQYGFANSTQVVNSYKQWVDSQPGYVDTTYGEVSDHKVVGYRVWETEAQIVEANTNLRSNVALYNAYSEILTNYRNHFNITADPVPGVAPYYYP